MLTMNGSSRPRMSTDPVMGILTNLQSICHSSLLGVYEENPVSPEDLDVMSKVQQLRTYQCSSFHNTPTVAADALTQLYLSLDHTAAVSRVDGDEWRRQVCRLIDAVLDVMEHGEAKHKALQIHMPPQGNIFRRTCVRSCCTEMHCTVKLPNCLLFRAQRMCDWSQRPCQHHRCITHSFRVPDLSKLYKYRTDNSVYVGHFHHSCPKGLNN